MTFGELFREGRYQLRAAGVPDAAADARQLLLFAAGITPAQYYLREPEEVPAAAEQTFRSLTERRAARIPLQHLLGSAEFMGLPFFVGPEVLVPRQDTELLAEKVLETVRGREAEGLTLLDLCTGSGCIAVSLAKLFSWGAVTASDLSEAALATARRTAAANGAPVRFLQGDLFEPVRGERFDVITVNPPYIPGGEIDGLMPEVRDHDPRMALDGGPDGLDFYRRLAGEAAAYLKNEGRLFMEIGHDQADIVRKLFAGAGWETPQIFRDYGGNDRLCVCRR